MGSHIGPRITTSSLLYTDQPGIQGRHMVEMGATVMYGSDVVLPQYRAVTGARRPNDKFEGASAGSTKLVSNFNSSIYEFKNPGYVYSISTWVKVIDFPSKNQKFGNGYVRTKRTALARFDYRNATLPNSGFIEFGAMAPFYYNFATTSNQYKFVYEPICFGAVFSFGISYRRSILTDYKFFKNTWYLLTVEITSDKTFDQYTSAAITTKFFVNGIQENIVAGMGTAWYQQQTGTNRHNTRRKNGYFPAAPGFLSAQTGVGLTSSSSQTFTVAKGFMDVRYMNLISYSPVIKMGEPGQSNIRKANTGSAYVHVPSGRGESPFTNSWVDIGQVYISSSTFDPNIFNSFKSLYDAGEFDNDAHAFIYAAGLTQSTQKLAIDGLVRSAKKNGWWNKCIAIYPIVGGTASTHKYNLKDPRDSDAAYRLSFTSGWTHSLNGIVADGATSTNANTFIVPSTKLTINDTHMSFYSRTAEPDGGSVRDMGCLSGVSNQMRIAAQASTITVMTMYSTGAGGNISVATGLGGAGLWLASRTSNSSFVGYKNGSSFGSNNTTHSGTLPNVSIYIGAQNGVNTNSSIKECAFATVGSGIDAATALLMYNDIQTYQKTLGRNV